VVALAKILAVDDEPDFELLIRQRFRREIRDEECEFRFAHHGQEALATLSSEPDIELMLLDINMPVMDGLTLLTELRERQLEVQAIIVSAYGDMTNLRTAMNRGAFDFVTKPVDLRDLEITVRKALANVAKLREMDRQRMAAERARNNLSRYFFPEHRRIAGCSRRTARGRSPRDSGCAVCRHCRVHANGGGHGSRRRARVIARVSYPNDGADLRKRRYG
jgi:DNA-binding NtrC family response regulator